MKASDVVCPTCDSDPGRKCKDMDLPEVHFTRALRADSQRVRKSEEENR